LCGKNGELHCSYLDELISSGKDISNMNKYFLPNECLIRENIKNIENKETKESKESKFLCPHRVSNTPDKQLIASYQSEIAGLYQ
jgi:hypothetical protein